MINVSSILKIALRALWVNKMRSFLTMLGIIIGVGSVITMLAVGIGAKEKVTELIASVGSNLIMVFPGSMTQSGIRMGSGSQASLTSDDAAAIERECSAVKAVAPVISTGAQIVYGNANWATAIHGTTPGILDVRDCSLVAGRNFTDQDIRSATKVCILGQTVVDNLFGSIDPVGQIVRIKKIPFVVIGVLETKGQSLMGQDQDDVIYIPVTTAQKRIVRYYLPGMVHRIMVKAVSAEDMSRAETQVTELLRQRHRSTATKENDFTVRNLTQMMQVAEDQARVMTVLLGAIALISLLIGGIGIMNIMLVSVTERTREIGIRMAIGAKTWDIRIQFIIEALTLSMIGGIFGIIIGVTSTSILTAATEWPTTISFFSIILAFSFSGLVGIFFGFYPAYKASLLNPIDALRYE